MGDVRNGFHVVDVAARVADAFGVQEPGVFIDRGREVGFVGGVHKPDVNAESF